MEAIQVVIDDISFESYKKAPDEKVTRGKSMNYVMDKIKEIDGLEAVKCKRKLGADILIFSKKEENKIIKANFYHSKTYNNFYPSSWHVLEAKDLENEDINIYIFNLKYYDTFYTYIFTREELIEYVKEKKKDHSGNYHMNFEIKNGEELENRDYIKNVKKYRDRYKSIQELLQHIKN
ncbi:MAG: hypothetical protein RR922_04560 [Clostridia bacterium]